MMQDIHVIQKSKNFPYTVEFYGVLFRQGEVLICMEAMNISLYHYYKTSHCGGFGMPQDILGAVLVNRTQQLMPLSLSLFYI